MKDYIKDKKAAQELADNIKNWWHSRGFTQVKTWLEEEKILSPHGTRLPSNFYVRGNISFNVDTIDQGMIE